MRMVWGERRARLGGLSEGGWFPFRRRFKLASFTGVEGKGQRPAIAQVDGAPERIVLHALKADHLNKVAADRDVIEMIVVGVERDAADRPGFARPAHAATQ